MINAHIIDTRGVYVRTVQVDPMGPQPAGAVYAVLPESQNGYTRVWFLGAWRQVPDADVPPMPEPVQPPDPIPPEVPRYCGVLALKRHRLADGELEALGDEEGWESGSLYAQLLAFRNALPSGALRDKLDIAIDHVMHWTLESPTVTEMCAVMGLSTAHRDALFRWAKAHEATL